MKQRKKSKYVHEGQDVAEVEVALVEDDTGWSPYLSVEDAYKLDDVKEMRFARETWSRRRNMGESMSSAR